MQSLPVSMVEDGVTYRFGYDKRDNLTREYREEELIRQYTYDFAGRMSLGKNLESRGRGERSPSGYRSGDTAGICHRLRGGDSGKRPGAVHKRGKGKREKERHQGPDQRGQQHVLRNRQDGKHQGSVRERIRSRSGHVRNQLYLGRHRQQAGPAVRIKGGHGRGPGRTGRPRLWDVPKP